MEYLSCKFQRYEVIWFEKACYMSLVKFEIFISWNKSGNEIHFAQYFLLLSLQGSMLIQYFHVLNDVKTNPTPTRFQKGIKNQILSPSKRYVHGLGDLQLMKQCLRQIFQKKVINRKGCWKSHFCCDIWISIPIASHPRPKFYWRASQRKRLPSMLREGLKIVKL